MDIIPFVVGLFVGSIAGVLLMGALNAASGADDGTLEQAQHNVAALARHIHHIEGHEGEMELCGKWPCVVMQTTE